MTRPETLGAARESSVPFSIRLADTYNDYFIYVVGPQWRRSGKRVRFDLGRDMEKAQTLPKLQSPPLILQLLATLRVCMQSRVRRPWCSRRVRARRAATRSRLTTRVRTLALKWPWYLCILLPHKTPDAC